MPIFTLALMSGCATTASQHEAAPDVRAFALALRDRDYPAIESRIDRPALQKQISGLARALAADEIARRVGGGKGGAVLGLLGADLAGPIIDYFTRRALEPDVLADIARNAGLTPQTNIPGKTLTAISLQRVADGRVCAPDPKTRACLLYFGKYPSGWKLNAVDETALRAKLVTSRAKS